MDRHGDQSGGPSIRTARYLRQGWLCDERLSFARLILSLFTIGADPDRIAIPIWCDGGFDPLALAVGSRRSIRDELRWGLKFGVEVHIEMQLIPVLQ